MLQVQYESLGTYGGSKSALMAIKSFEYMKINEASNILTLAQLTHAVNAVTALQ